MSREIDGGLLIAVADPLPVDPGQGVQAAAADATGSSKLRWIATSAAAALTGVVVKGSAGVVYGYHIANQHASTAIYVHFYDAASATGVPEMTLKVLGNAVLDSPQINPPIGDWTNGIFVSVSNAADGMGTPAAAPLVNIFWK